jgi:hypothetical protein
MSEIEEMIDQLVPAHVGSSPEEQIWVLLSGRCEKIDFQICSELGVKKNRSRMPYKRPLGCRQAIWGQK